jgi:translation initiation factor 1
MSDAKLVYSSELSRQEVKKTTEPRKDELKPSGPCKLRLEKKGRGGKQVSIIYHLPLTATDATLLMRELQAKLSCGASYKNGEILISGDQRTEIEKFFAGKNLKIIRAGG